MHFAHLTWWFFVSLFVYLTVSPALTETAFGTKPAAVIETDVVAAVFAVAAGISAAPVSAASSRTFFMG
jgi:hypothetical protein